MSRTAPARARPRPRRSGHAAQAVSRRAIKIKYFQKITRHQAPGRRGADAAVAWSRIPPSSLLLPLPVSLLYALCSLFGENQTTSACRGRDEVRPGRIGAPEIGADLERHEAEVDEQGAGARVPAVEPHGVRREDLPGPRAQLIQGYLNISKHFLHLKSCAGWLKPCAGCLEQRAGGRTQGSDVLMGNSTALCISRWNSRR